MALGKLTREQKLSQQSDLRKSVSKSRTVQRETQARNDLDSVSRQFGAGSFAERAVLPGAVTGQQKIAKSKYMEAGGAKGTGVMKASEYMGNQIAKAGIATPKGFEFAKASSPQQGEREDPKDYQIRVANWERNQAMKQANAIASATVGIRGEQEKQRQVGTEEMFQERGAAPAMTKQIINPEFQRLSAEEKKVNARLPEGERLEQHVTLGEEDLTPQQREARSKGIGIRFTRDQELDAIKRGGGKRSAIDPFTGKSIKTSLGDQTDRMRRFLSAEDGDILDVDGDGQFVLKSSETGEIIDPVKRAEDKVEKKIAKQRERLEESHRISTDRILAANRTPSGGITAQGQRLLNKEQENYNDQREEFDENAKDMLNSTINAEKRRQDTVEMALATREEKKLDAFEQQKVAWINEQKAKNPNASIDYLMNKWSAINKYDSKGEKEANIGQDLDAIMQGDEDDITKFDKVYASAGQNLDDTYKAFSSRYGDAYAKKLKQEFLQSQGWDDGQLQQEEFKDTVLGLYNGDIQNPVEVGRFVKSMKGVVSDEFVAGQLESIINSPLNSESVKDEARALLGDYKEEAATPSMLLENVQKNPRLFGELPASDKSDLIAQGFVPEVKMSPTGMSGGAGTAGGGGFTSGRYAIPDGGADATKNYETAAQGDPEAAAKVEAITGSRTGTDLADIPNSAASGFLRSRVVDLLTMKQKSLLGDGDFVGILKASAGGKAMSDSTINKISKARTTLSQLQGLGAKLSDKKNEEISDADGNGWDISPITGWLAERNPWDTDSQSIKSILRSTVPNLARGVYGEVGVLTDKDIEVYSQTIPNLRQTDDVKKAVMGITLNVVRDSIRNTLEDNASSGRNVSGFVQMYEDVNNQIAKIEDDLGISSKRKPKAPMLFPQRPPQQQPEQDLGAVSEKYESRGDSSAIGYDKVGGNSYGAYQMTKGTAQNFAQQFGIKAAVGSKEFDTAWKTAVQKDPAAFKQAERKYIKGTHYDPQMRRLEKNLGIKEANLSNKLKHAIWSTSVQHGGNTDVIEKIFKNLPEGATENYLLEQIYNERATRFPSSTPQVQSAVKNRYFGKGGELETLKQMA